MNEYRRHRQNRKPVEMGERQVRELRKVDLSRQMLALDEVSGFRIRPGFYGINGARGFWTPYWQILLLAMAEGLFDRFFIDWYWVGHTKAWTIPGTEDLKPYIPRKTLIVKWLLTIIGNPIIAAVLAGIMFPIFGH